MKTIFLSTKAKSAQGSTLLIVIFITSILMITILSMVLTSSNGLNNAYGRVDWNKAFFFAENATVWAAQKSYDSLPAVGSSITYSTAGGTLPLTNIVSSATSDPSFSGAWVKVAQSSNSPANVFLITASAKVNNKVRTVQTLVTIRPVSEVFDYEYFLNNWGWWWGNTITGNGGQRSNWDFDFKYNPTVNGQIYAAGEVDDNKVAIQKSGTIPFSGLAGTDITNYVHQGAPRVSMPNLLNFSNYIAKALSNTASNGIWLGSTQLVVGVLTNASQPGIYLEGTTANPLRIKGTVVVNGDVVIKGKITGQGTLYVGGNLYVANDLTYTNSANYSTLPETLSNNSRDAWVAANQTKDLVAYAVRGSILAGDVTDRDWINWCNDYPGSGLSNVGDEAHLGRNGIDEGRTGDDTIAYTHPDVTGTTNVTDTSYDADGDGIIRGNYNYATEINMDLARAAKIKGYPTSGGTNLANYQDVATSNMGNLDGVFYTNHAAAMRLKFDTSTVHGSVISRNEQIIFQHYLNFIYDSRVHSRYANNPNLVINLGLPWGRPLAVNSFSELTPDSTGL